MKLWLGRIQIIKILEKNNQFKKNIIDYKSPNKNQICSNEDTGKKMKLFNSSKNDKAIKKQTSKDKVLNTQIDKHNPTQNQYKMK
jgi:hypothetical protein